MKTVICLKPTETLKILREHGVKMSMAMLKTGLEHGIFPFGIAVKVVKNTEYEIYHKLLMDWISERSEEVTE